MEEIDPADTDRTERVAVIRVAEAKKLLLRFRRARPARSLFSVGGPIALMDVRTIRELPVLERLLQCDLDRGRSGIRKENSRESLRCDVDQRGCETNAGLVTESEERRVRELIDLPLERCIETRMTMTMDVAPERADAIEVARPVGVEEKAAFASSDHEGRPLRHLRERVPGNLTI